MCIFAQPVRSVTKTNIFARLQPDGWQHLVYQMNFQTTTKNAIILPLPVQHAAAEEDMLQFISLQKHNHFFRDIASGFPLAPQSRSFSRGSVDSQTDSPKLAVHEVGDFVASFVPKISDFARLDEQFRVPQESWDKIPAYSDYGFAVFQLKSMEGKPHPMAFKFKSRLSNQDNGSIFFPTVHIHDGEVHSREEFDHTLYLQSSQFDAACGDYQQRSRLVTDPATGYVRSKWPAKKFCYIPNSKGILSADQLVHRLEMKGMLKNTDVLARQNMSHASLQMQQSSSRSRAATTLFASVVGLQWFCNRRNQISNPQ